MAELIERVPSAIDVEISILGAMLMGPEGLERGLVCLTATDFYKESHRRIFSRLAELHAGGRPADFVVLLQALMAANELEAIGGKAAIIAMTDTAATVAQLDSYAGIVRELAAKREFMKLGMDLLHGAQNGRSAVELEQQARQRLDAVIDPIGRAAHGFQKPLTLAQLAAAPPPEPAWLVEGLVLQQANGWLGAGAKVGKSYLALDLMLACALGEPWLAHFPVPRPLVVVLVEEEDSAWRVYQRATRLCAGRGVEMPANFHVTIRSGLQLDNHTTLDPFLRWLGPLRADLVVWDVLNKLHSKDEKRPDQMLPILRRVDRIRDELGCANLIAHHSRKPGTSGPDLASGGQKLRGPSEFWGWAENSLYLAPLKGKGILVVEPESKDAIVEPFKVHLEDLPDDGRRWIYDGVVQAKVAEGAKTRQAIIDALATGPMTAAALADHVGKSERAVKSHLSALEKDGALDSMKEPGRYGKRTWMLQPEAQASDDVLF